MAGWTDTRDAPPRGFAARREWAGNRAGADLKAHVQARAASHGVDPANPPQGWLTPAYLADAGKHPEVHDYFTRYRHLLQELDTTSVSVFISSMQTRLRESGLRPSEVNTLMADLRAEMDQEAPEIRRRSDNELALVSAALELHAYLESVDPRAHLDEAAGAVRFAREAEGTRAYQLVDEVNRRSAVVQAQGAAGA